MFCLNQISQRLNSQNSHRNAVFVAIFVAIFFLGITFFEFYFPPEVRETPPRNSIEYEFFLNKAADVKEVNIFYK